MAKVFVQHEPRHDHSGNVIGIGARSSGHVVQDVVWEYRHKDKHGNKVVRTSSGDVWSVKPWNSPDYQYKTI